MDGRRDALAVVLLPLLIAAVSGPPSVSGLRGADPFGPMVTVLALLAWACAAWLLLVLLLGVAGRSGSRLARVLLERIAPASIRSLVGLAVGAAVTLAAVPPSSAEVPPSPAAELDLDWGRSITTAPPSHLVRAAPITRAAMSPPDRLRSDGTVTVHAGDSLWSIAARALGPRAGNPQIAFAWPSWWAANRVVIGSNPDLIQPGAVLVRPKHLGEA